MFTLQEVIQLSVGGFLWWLAVYSVSRNIRSKVAWLLFFLLFSFSVLVVTESIYPHLLSPSVNALVNRLTDWSYLLPIALLFHLSVIVTGREMNKLNNVLIYVFYALSLFYILASLFTNSMVNYSIVKDYLPGLGYINPRGPLFITLTFTTFFVSFVSLVNYLAALKNELPILEKWKFFLPAVTSLLYALVSPYLVYQYVYGDIVLAIQLTGAFLVLPFIPILISIIWFRLISDIESIFNLREFTYLTIVILLINLVNGAIFLSFASIISESAYYLLAIFVFVSIFTHGFYDWLTTFIRDLLYSTGNGFSLITDADVNDLLRNFHDPEKLETNSLLKFKSARRNAENGKLVDSAQNLTRDAIEYLKQSDFPRRTKQNLKYQLLIMLTQDSAEEGQILWELGFDGYPMKILSGEDRTRKPLFKIESMSDYTATSRNAFIALKKEAVHDLAWRLSYLERTRK